MPYRNLANKLIETFAKDGAFEVDYMDEDMTTNIVSHLRERGCDVSFITKTRIHVDVPREGDRPTSGRS